MRALVTGATGFIGSHVAELLKSKGYKVRCTVRKSSNLRWLEGKDFEIADASLSSKKDLYKALEDVDLVIHSAGLVAAKNYDEFLKANRDGTKNLIEAAYELNPNLKRFLYVSSQTAAGPAESADKPVIEDMPMNPITAYGRSKKAGEEVVRSFSEKLPVTIVRPSAVYGPRDTATFTIFQTVNKGLATLIGFNKKLLNLVNSTDLTRGIIDAAESEKAIGNTYFLASEEIYDWVTIMNEMKNAFSNKNLLTLRIPHPIVYGAAALSEFIGKFSSKPPVFNFDKGRDFVQTYWLCSVEKAKKDFDYKQEVSLEEGFKETIKWYRDNKWF